MVFYGMFSFIFDAAFFYHPCFINGETAEITQSGFSPPQGLGGVLHWDVLLLRSGIGQSSCYLQVKQ